jgi:superfamily II DNA or RNA helicase
LPEIVDPVTGLKKRRNRARGVIIITTYSMITKARERSEHPMIARMKQRRHWGTCIIDEVHKLPARTF